MPETTQPHRRAGRPTSRILTRDGITDAALAIVRTKGYESLTIASLAKHLHVTPSAMYNHARSKQDIMRSVQDRLMAGIDDTELAGIRRAVAAGEAGPHPWRHALLAWATSYRDLMARHTSLVHAIATMPITGAPETLAMYEVVVGALVDVGWPRDRVLALIVALESFVYGSAYDVSAPDDIFDTAGFEPSAPTFTSVLLERSEDAHSYTRSGVGRESFERGAMAIVDAFAAAAGVDCPGAGTWPGDIDASPPPPANYA
ncbi:TetR/AcrR family transcriptional regulator [Microbacterium mangrovi]|uniref:TetR/AcrR family transcriptional regulator n=1 Tax=Microbacterium mangrovi TaxID=1348253 RepID=UPI00068FA49A|nr:TetR/AcrR family transcriptional regulator [Microbacterium mangrovi]